MIRLGLFIELFNKAFANLETSRITVVWDWQYSITCSFGIHSKYKIISKKLNIDALIHSWVHNTLELIYKTQKPIQDKVFKNGPSKMCGRQPLKSLKGYGLFKQTISLQTF